MKFTTKKSKSMNILMVPYPAQGHVTPMLKLATTFLNLGLNPILVVPEFIYPRIKSSVYPYSEISCIPIQDGMELDSPRNFFSIENFMENDMPFHVGHIIQSFNQDGQIGCLVVDLLASPAIEVARRFRIPVAGFWPAMLATYYLIAAIPELVRAGYICESGYPQNTGKTCFQLPNQPMLSTEDLPWLIGSPASINTRFKFWIRTFNRSKNLKWLLVNSFPQEHEIEIKKQCCQIIDTTLLQPIIHPIVPLTTQHTTKNPSFGLEDMSCIEWLDNQNPNSVIYISFGSWVSPIGEAKVKSLAMSLETLGLKFIWVLGLGWRDGLPNGFMERILEMDLGKVVSWAPQMKLLQHRAIGLYLSHCGWNSTMEAIGSQKRLLCYPIAGDQFLNCEYIVKVWKIGVKLEGFGEKDIEEGMQRVIEDGEMKIRLMKLRLKIVGDEAWSRAMSNVTTFVDDLHKQLLYEE